MHGNVKVVVITHNDGVYHNLGVHRISHAATVRNWMWRMVNESN
jgi:hypothetical protein